LKFAWTNLNQVNRSIKNILLLTLFCLTYESSLSQISGSRLFVLLEVNPNIGYRKIRTSNLDPTQQTIAKFRDSIETPVQNVSFGLNGGLTLNNAWEISVGLRYATKGEQLKNRLSVIDPNDPLNGASHTAISRSRFLEIPLRASYHLFLPERRYVFTIEPYWSRYQNMAFTTYIKPNDEPLQKTKSLDHSRTGDFVFVGIGAQVGIQHSFTDKFALRVSPSFRMDLFELTGTNTSVFYWNAGIDIGAHFNW